MAKKLHELLAAESNIKAKAEVIRKEGINTFLKKQGHFKGQIRKYTPRFEDDVSFPDESQALTETAPKKLAYIMKSLVSEVNAIHQKELTNTTAFANVVIDGKPIIENVCATSLLAMEKIIKKWREIYLYVPTLDPGVSWIYDEKNEYYISDPIETVKQKKVNKPIVLYEATKEHPAQVQLETFDEAVGTWKTTYISGAIPASLKAEYLEKIDKLEIAIKEARQRANNVELSKQEKVGEVLYKYIMS